MGIFKAKHMDQAVTAAISSGDKLFFTKEEKADFSKQIADAQVDYIKTSMSEGSIRSMTRRWLSISIMFVFLSLLLASVVIGFWNKEHSEFTFSVAKELFGLTMMVAGFFFGGYMVKNTIMPAINKKSRK